MSLLPTYKRHLKRKGNGQCRQELLKTLCTMSSYLIYDKTGLAELVVSMLHATYKQFYKTLYLRFPEAKVFEILFLYW